MCLVGGLMCAYSSILTTFDYWLNCCVACPIDLSHIFLLNLFQSVFFSVVGVAVAIPHTFSFWPRRGCWMKRFLKVGKMFVVFDLSWKVVDKSVRLMNGNNDIRSKCHVKSLNVECVLFALDSDFKQTQHTHTECRETDMAIIKLTYFRWFTFK